jgi:peptide/nickel transport system permease protein
LADNASRLNQATHLVIFPGAAIVISVLGLNLIGDGLRESIDPKLRS